MRLRTPRPRPVALLLTCVALALLGLAPPAGAAPATADGTGRFAPYPGSAPGGSFFTNVQSGVITAGSCSYRQANDDPHLSSGDTSIHGWWLYVSGSCPTTANVDQYLQAYWCDSLGCRWVTVASGSGDYRAGGGSGRRATAREGCSSTARLVGWRGFTDVDLNGQADPPGYTYSNIRNLYCSP